MKFVQKKNISGGSNPSLSELKVANPESQSPNNSAEQRI